MCIYFYILRQWRKILTGNKLISLNLWISTCSNLSLWVTKFKTTVRKMIYDTEIFYWWISLKILCTVFNSNISILEELETQQWLANIIQLYIFCYFRHVCEEARRRKKCNEKRIVERKKTGGRFLTIWMEQITRLLGKPLYTLVYIQGTQGYTG